MKPCFTAREFRYGPSSGGETRTLNLAVNSRLLCQLSYPGIAPVQSPVGQR